MLMFLAVFITLVMKCLFSHVFRYDHQTKSEVYGRIEMTLLEHDFHEYHYTSDKLHTLHDSY